jgi:ferritin-like metal-binding protein YciE
VITHMNKNERLSSWLNDAYAMEEGLVQILETHARRAGDLPAVSARIKAHAEETREQARRLRRCLELLGTAPGSVRATLSSLVGAVEGASTVIFTDELVKNALADYASEHFEIACYSALIAAAEEAGETEIVGLLRQSLEEEQRMANWLREQLPVTVRHVLNSSS